MTASEPKSLNSYSQEDVQQILQMAITREADAQDKEFSYEQILEIAAELEISPESLNLAARDWAQQKSEIQQRKAFDNYRFSKLKKRVGNYVIFNSFILLIDWLSESTISWSLYILLFCGLIVGLDVWNTFQMKGEEYEIKFQKWNRKHQIKKTINSVLDKLFNALRN